MRQYFGGQVQLNQKLKPPVTYALCVDASANEASLFHVRRFYFPAGPPTVEVLPVPDSRPQPAVALSREGLSDLQFPNSPIRAVGVPGLLPGSPAGQWVAGYDVLLPTKVGNILLDRGDLLFRHVDLLHLS